MSYFDENCIHRVKRTYAGLDQRDRELVDLHRKGASLADLVMKAWRPAEYVLSILDLPPGHFSWDEMLEADRAWRRLDQYSIESQLRSKWVNPH
jgi:hypothetical protein